MLGALKGRYARRSNTSSSAAPSGPSESLQMSGTITRASTLPPSVDAGGGGGGGGRVRHQPVFLAPRPASPPLPARFAPRRDPFLKPDPKNPRQLKPVSTREALSHGKPAFVLYGASRNGRTVYDRFIEFVSGTKMLPDPQGYDVRFGNMLALTLLYMLGKDKEVDQILREVDHNLVVRSRGKIPLGNMPGQILPRRS
jgi:hypothetical protein